MKKFSCSLMDAINQLFGIMALAFSLGLIHALDADHIMAVSVLAGSRPGIRQSIGFCTRWALGHGAALLLVSLVVLVLGWMLPTIISHWAEQLVGVVLILLGVRVYLDIRRQRLQVQLHKHGNDIMHAHWCVDVNRADQNGHREHKHSATLVGLMHGVAGSAPILALLPISKLGSAWTGMLYVLIFGLGVFITMLLFGGLLGRLFAILTVKGRTLIELFRGLVATASVGYGIYLLGSAVI